MSTVRGGKETPAWVLPLVIVAGVLLLAGIAWHALSGPGEGAPGPAKEVHAGMYDFRAEAQKGTLGRKSEDSALPH